MKIGDKIEVVEEFEVGDYVNGVVVGTVIRPGDKGEIIANDCDTFQVLMETGDYAGIITDIDPPHMTVK